MTWLWIWLWGIPAAFVFSVAWIYAREEMKKYRGEPLHMDGLIFVAALWPAVTLYIIGLIIGLAIGTTIEMARARLERKDAP